MILIFTKTVLQTINISVQFLCSKSLGPLLEPMNIEALYLKQTLYKFIMNNTSFGEQEELSLSVTVFFSSLLGELHAICSIAPLSQPNREYFCNKGQSHKQEETPFSQLFLILNYSLGHQEFILSQQFFQKCRTQTRLKKKLCPHIFTFRPVSHVMF